MTPDNPLHQTNHELWQLLRNRVDAGAPMTAIAAELGVPVDDLCTWIMAYRAPRRPKPYQGRTMPPLSLPKRVGTAGRWATSPDNQRRLASERSRAAAALARGIGNG